jgi:predicted TIM-barrel fold metal-dependent hydrolase
MTIHDAHCHFFSAKFFETLAAGVKDLQGPDRGTAAAVRLGWEPPGEPEVLADRWAAEMDRHGVGRAALIASVPQDEVSVAAAVARRPDRFVGFFMLDPTRPDAGSHIERAVAELGLRCVCLFPAMHHFRVDDDRVLRLLEPVAARPRTALFVHCGVLSVGARARLGVPSRFDMRLGDPLAVHAAAAAFPSVPFLVPHFGAGFFREALMAADLSSNIYFDTSSSNRWMTYHPGLTLPDVFRRALDVVGPKRIVFGTDSSFFPRGWQRQVFEVQKAALEAVGADRETQAQIFGGNFDALFPAEHASSTREQSAALHHQHPSPPERRG